MDTDKIYAEAIVNEYSKKEDSKVKALKRLDKKVKLLPTIFTYVFGVIGALILGVGMCFSMKIFGDSTTYFVIGIVIGIIGIILVSINYPIYKLLLEKRKQKYACDIITLAKEIAEEDK